MRVLGWVLFAATCVMFVLQGRIRGRFELPDDLLRGAGRPGLSAAGNRRDRRRRRRSADRIPLPTKPHRMVAADRSAGQRHRSWQPRRFAFSRSRVSDLAVGRPNCGIPRHEVFGATFLVTAMAVIFMIAPDGRLLSRRWRLAVAVPVAALALRCVAIAITPADVYLPGSVERLGSLAELVLLASFSLMLLSISARCGRFGAAIAAFHRPATPSTALDIDIRRGSRGEFCALRVERTATGLDAVDSAGGDVPGLHLLFGERRRRDFPIPALRHRRDPQSGDRTRRAGGLRHRRLHRRRGCHRRCARGGRRARIDLVLAVVGRDRAGRGRVPTRSPAHTPAGGSTGLRKPGRAVRGPRHAQPATRGQPITRRPAGQGRRGHRTRRRGRRRQGADRSIRGNQSLVRSATWSDTGHHLRIRARRCAHSGTAGAGHG